MSYINDPYEEENSSPLIPMEYQGDLMRWEAAYAEELDRQMEAQYNAELEAGPFETLSSPALEYDLAHQVLNCRMIQPNDGNAQTVGEFLGLLLSTLWVQGEGFSPKRPLGNSDWQWQVYMSLVAGGLAEGVINKWDEEDIKDEVAADELILSAIRLAYDHGV